MRKVATFQLYAFYTVSELIGLYPWNMTNIINYYFELNLEYTSKFLCHFISYVQYCSFEISSWILVVISIDRLVFVKWAGWHKRHINSKKVYLVALILVAFFCAWNLPFALNNGYIAEISLNNSNETSLKLICHSNPNIFIINFWSWSLTSLFVVIPFIIQMMLNVLLIKQIRQIKSKATNVRSRKQERCMQITVLSMSFSYMIASLPTGSIQGQVYVDLIQTEIGQIVIIGCNALLATYQAGNIIIFLVTNKRFFDELMSIFGYRVAPSSYVQTNSLSTRQSRPKNSFRNAG